VTSEISESFSALDSASVDSVWETPNSAHQPTKPGLIVGNPPISQYEQRERQQEGEAAPDVDVLVERVAQALHGGVAQHLEQRCRQRQSDPHTRRLPRGLSARPETPAARG
jgi:hypothetical protein